MTRLMTLIATAALASGAAAQSIEPREGWEVHKSSLSYDDLVTAVKEAAPEHSLGVVTDAGPTQAAAARGVTIPGNRVIGLFNNVYAVRILGLSTAAMIEAPIRMYVTENEDGTATLSYKTPTYVFTPYFDEGGADLEAAAKELDAMFGSVALQAAGE